MSATLPSPGPEASPLHWLTLRFMDPDLEAAYTAEHRARSLILIRLAVALGAVLYSGFGLLDPLIIPAGVHAAWAIRYGLVLPLSLGALALSFLPGCRRWIEGFWLALGPLYGLGIVAMIHIAPAPGSYYYYAGLMLVCSYTWTCVHQEPLRAAFVCTIIVLGYEAVALLSGIPIPILISNNFFLLTANIIGAAACYVVNRLERLDFQQKRQIQDQAERLQAAVDHVRTLRGLLPICAWCNRIRDDQGAWSQLVDYIPRHSDANFTHGICPDCRDQVTRSGSSGPVEVQQPG